MTTVTATQTTDTIHRWEAAGLGRAPFRCVAIIETPGKNLLEANPTAYNNAAAEAQQSAQHFGVMLSSCNACGQCLQINCIIRDADGRHFVVGSDCVRKTGDAGLIFRVKHEERVKQQARKEAERAARWEAEAPLRAARQAEADRLEAEREAAQLAEEARLEAENGWLIDILIRESHSAGDFCSSVAADLRRKTIADLSPRCLDIVRDIYGKATGGRKGSKKFEAAVAEFDRRAGIEAE
jgi:hypothetical protein